MKDSTRNVKNITVRKVSTKREMDDFVQFAHRLYRGCEYYVPDLDSDIREAFDQKKNFCLKFSDIQPFVAYDEEGTPVGRVAGIINHRANKKWGTKNVRFGFIEFVDDLRVSAALLSAVEQWGREHGMEYIQGPMGVFDFDKEGMLVEDFDQTSSMIAIYNYPYYPRHMEQLGFEKEADWVHISVEIPKELPAKYVRVAKLSQEMFGLHTRKLTKKDLTTGGYGHRAFQLFNAAYAPLFGYTELDDDQIGYYLKRYMPLLDGRWLSVVENADGEMVGIAVTVLSLSHALQKSKGKLWPVGWYHILRSLTWKKEGKAEMLLIAVRPDYQGLGINALFFTDLIDVYNRYGIKWAETGPQLEDNVRELSQWKPLNPTMSKRRRCYRKKISQE